jgi:hypothetical protein
LNEGGLTATNEGTEDDASVARVIVATLFCIPLKNAEAGAEAEAEEWAEAEKLVAEAEESAEAGKLVAKAGKLKEREMLEDDILISW